MTRAARIFVTNRKAADELVTVADEMQDLVTEVKGKMGYSTIAYLTLQKQRNGSHYLRWRVPGPRNQRPYIDLTSPTGLSMLNTMPFHIRRYVLETEHRIIELNHKHAAILSNLKREQLKKRNIAKLEQLSEQLAPVSNS